MEFDKILTELEGLSDDALLHIGATTASMSAPWQQSVTATGRDSDGFAVEGSGLSENMYLNFQVLQKACWDAFNSNPFIFTTISDMAGRLTGRGFTISSPEPKIQEAIESTWEDPRNDLVTNISKYVTRHEVQGELFLVLTLHNDGFVEVDFFAPSRIKGGTDGTGVISHSKKSTMPLMYIVEVDEDSNEGTGLSTKYIPSINLAYYPELRRDVKNVAEKDILGKKGGKYTQFMLCYSSGAVSKRNVGRVKTTLEWLAHYDELKKWEIDHKKSAGSYLWAISIEDKASLRMWLSMTPEQRAETGITAKKSPGGTLILPPGFKLDCKNPSLTAISGQDTDILQMVSAGMNVQSETMTGSSSGVTYGGAKTGAGPATDRTSDQIENLERFFIQHFWRAIFFLKNSVSKSKFPLSYKVERAVRFSDGEPVFKKVSVAAHKLVDVDFPVSATADIESVARAFLGVKHASVTDQLGLAPSSVAKKLGIGSYTNQRLQAATEEKQFPKLLSGAELESNQSVAGETGLEPPAKTPKTT